MSHILPLFRVIIIADMLYNERERERAYVPYIAIIQGNHYYRQMLSNEQARVRQAP